MMRQGQKLTSGAPGPLSGPPQAEEGRGFADAGRRVLVLETRMPTSITTRRGDAGRTDLLFGGRVGKSHPRLLAVGDVDELNAALGLVRVYVRTPDLGGIAARAQADLVALMGLLAAGPEHAARYAAQGFPVLGGEAVERLTAEAAALEAQFPDGFGGWSTPGEKGGAGSAWLEMARCVCRRAERSVAALEPEDFPENPHLLPWLNRLSDLLWLAARVEEREPPEAMV